MPKVYVVQEESYHDNEPVYGVFSSRELAEAALPYYAPGGLSIHELEVDEVDRSVKYTELWCAGCGKEGVVRASTHREKESLAGTNEFKFSGACGWGCTEEEARAQCEIAKAKFDPVFVAARSRTGGGKWSDEIGVSEFLAESVRHSWEDMYPDIVIGVSKNPELAKQAVIAYETTGLKLPALAYPK